MPFPHLPRRRVWLAAAMTTLLIGACETRRGEGPEADGAYHVRPGESIQRALERAAADPQNKVVRVHAGTYRPEAKGQALVWFNARHDGITLEAIGEAVLDATHPELGSPGEPGYPAVVNHVVYFGDGISERTILRGFTVRGANGFVINSGERSPIERNRDLPKNVYFYTDGGGIKIFGRSYPVIENVKVVDNTANPCGGGVSVQHLGFNERAPTFRHCIFHGNQAQVTGSAVDLLPGSAARFESCLFVGNISNTGDNFVPATGDRDYNAEHGSGALTVFAGSRAEVVSSTFTGNWNGVDDRGGESSYEHTIFWKNTATGGRAGGERYELDLSAGSRVEGCAIGGSLGDLRGTIDPERNIFDAEDPRFDEQFRPTSDAYTGIGYRPVEARARDTSLQE